MRKNRTFRPHSQRPRFPRSSGGRSSGRFTRDYRSEVRYNRNTYITAPEVRLIGSDGENVGVVDIKTALERAREEGLDLVEVAPNAQPPVCRIIPWSKFLYEQKKKENEARKNKQKEMKEFRFGTFIAEGDKERQVNRAKEFLDKGHNVKLTVWRKGRTPIEHSKLLLKDLLTRFAAYSTIDAVPQVEGKQVSMMIKGATGGSSDKQEKKDAETKDEKNSSKEIQDDQAPRGEGDKGTVREEPAGTSAN